MYFEKNISVLARTDPELANTVTGISSMEEQVIVNTKSGLPSLRVNGIALHSLYDPAKEAVSWVQYYEGKIKESSDIVVLGFGLGYHLLELCRSTDKQITVLENRLDILRRALESVDLTPILSRIRIITDSKIPSLKNKIAVLQHKPSVNLNRKYFDDILVRLKSRELINRGLRILVVGPIYGGSLPIARYCSSSLIKMGHTVEFIDNSRFDDALFLVRDIASDTGRYNRLVDLLSSFLSEVVMARCEVFKPDLVLALAQAPLTPDCLENLRRHKVTTAYWFVEDFRFMDYWEKIAGYYDFFFTIQKGEFFDRLQAAGIENFYYLPLAACPDVHKPVQLSDEEMNYYGSDVSFVGAGYYNRRHFLKGLIDFDFKIWGTDWDMHSALARHIQRSGARVDTDEIVKIFNATKININLHSSTYHKGINPFGDFVNPRTFEIISSGGFQLVDRRSEIEELFEVGEEVIVFDSLDDLRDKIRFYLDNTKERERIIRSGRQKVLREHTYENRMAEMLGYIAEGGLEPPEWDEKGEDVQRLIEESGRDTELGKYLSQFAEKRRITLDDITEQITCGEGDISKPEAVFLMMREFVR